MYRGREIAHEDHRCPFHCSFEESPNPEYRAKLRIHGEHLSMHTLYVQYGSAACAPKGWRNFDVSPTLRLQRIPFLGGLFNGQEYLLFPKNVEYGDIIEGLPISQKSCAGIYCSHVLEHLSLRDFRIASRNTYESLAANGIFRFVLPDLERLARDYLDSDDPRAALLFMERSYLGTPARSRGMKGLLRRHWGNSAHL